MKLRYILLTLLPTLLTIALSGCSPSDPGGIRPPVNKAVAILDEAIFQIGSAQANLRDVLENTRDKLIAEGQSTLANEVANSLSRAISDVGIETRCGVDFLRNRAQQDLVRLRATITGEQFTLNPVFCKVNPPEVIMDLPPERRPSLEISGYNLDYASVRAVLIDHQKGEIDVTYALGHDSQYQLILNLGSNGVPLSSTSEEIVFYLSGGEKQNVKIRQPFPVVPRHARITVTFDTLYNPDSSNECEAEAYLELKVNNIRDVWGKQQTDQDISTIPDCGINTGVNRSITVDLGEKDILSIAVDMYEKDGDYHLAAYYRREFHGVVEWSRSPAVTGTSTRAPNDYGDQDFTINYTISVQWIS